MIRLDYYGVEGTGRTLKEAKADAGRKIEAMLKGDYVPETITFRGHVALVWREPYGWFSKTLTDGETGQIVAGRRLDGSASSATRAETVTAARMSLAQTAWASGDTSADLADFVEFLGDHHEAASFTSWVRFQLKYKELRAQGVPETDCHRQACEAMYA